MRPASPKQLRVHDLIGPLPSGVVVADIAQEQTAVDACLARAPFVVVRRAMSTGERIAVGVRGVQRTERYAAWTARQHAAIVIAPEHLRLRQRSASLPAFRALAELEQRWAGFELPWGPAGSVGFALASGADCVGPQSDLDVVVRASSLPAADEAEAWSRTLEGLPCRVDVQVETPGGGVALPDLLAGHGRVLLRTPHGPQLIALPVHGMPDTACTEPRPA